MHPSRLGAVRLRRRRNHAAFSFYLAWLLHDQRNPCPQGRATSRCPADYSKTAMQVYSPSPVYRAAPYRKNARLANRKFGEAGQFPQRGDALELIIFIRLRDLVRYQLLPQREHGRISLHCP